ncbi:MAG: DUF2934 domain-containing protein [Candidatus Acidiferrales bacterium]
MGATHSPRGLARRERGRFGKPAGRGGIAHRECIAMRDLTECLLQAYDSVADRAYRKYLNRGAEPGRELDDWLSAEREMQHELDVDISESESVVTVLASVPGFLGDEIDIGVESGWLIILGRRSRTARPGDPENGSSLVGAKHAAPGKGAWHRRVPSPRSDNPANGPAPPQIECIFSVIPLPADVDPTRCNAVLADGLLGIRMPKRAN